MVMLLRCRFKARALIEGEFASNFAPDAQFVGGVDICFMLPLDS